MDDLWEYYGLLQYEFYSIVCFRFSLPLGLIFPPAFSFFTASTATIRFPLTLPPPGVPREPWLHPSSRLDDAVTVHTAPGVTIRRGLRHVINPHEHPYTNPYKTP